MNLMTDEKHLISGTRQITASEPAFSVRLTGKTITETTHGIRSSRIVTRTLLKEVIRNLPNWHLKSALLRFDHALWWLLVLF